MVGERLILLLSTLLLALSGWGDTLVVGVLAKRGAAKVHERWDATARYLERQLPEHAFRIEAFSFDDLAGAVERKEVDFVLTNSSYYVELEAEYGASRIATLVNLLADGRHDTRFGGVLFTRSDNPSIRQLSDLDGKRLMAVDPLSFGGWHMAQRELEKARVRPEKVLFAGTHDRVVEAILAKEADAGTVRTDTLERMAMEGKIDLEKIRVVPAVPCPGFPLRCSTTLYPEWPFATLKHVKPELAKAVAVALFKMEPEQQAAVKARIGGWTIPLDYQPVHLCLKELGLGPYARGREITPARVVKQYGTWIAAGLAALLLALAAAFQVTRLNRKLIRHQKEVQRLNRTLEERVKERTRALEELTDSLEERVEHEVDARRKNEALLIQQSKMAAMGEMIGAIAHQWRQPLNSLFLTIQDIKDAYEYGELDQTYVENLVKRGEKQIHFMDRTIEVFRTFFRPDLEKSRFQLMETIREVAELVAQQMKHHNIQVVLEGDEELALVGYPNQLKQVILNLLNNARDALEEQEGERTVRITVAREERQAAIRVADNGPGIAPEILAKLFQPYLTSKGEKGTGVGLSLSRTIVEERFGGSLTGENLEKGALFQIRLPL